MTPPFAEYRDVSVTEPLRQGDVLEAVEEGADTWRRHLLVITADCDFANAKHQGRVTCVPLLSQDEYLLEFVYPRVRDRVLSKTVNTLHDVLAGLGAPPVSIRRLAGWPLEQSPSEIADVLGLEGRSAADVEMLFDAVRTLSERPRGLGDAVKRLIRAQVDIPNGKKPTTAHREVTDALKAHYLHPPGDALFLSAVAPRMEAGYFVYLRHLEQIHEPDISLGPVRGPAKYRRLARLQDRFIHALSQQFGMVFMAIGLPAEYEEMRNLHADLLGDRYQ